MSQRLYLTFDKTASQSPILSSLTAKYGVVFNIFGATVNDDVQLFAIELHGEDAQIERAVAFLRDEGVRVEIRDGGSDA